MKESKTYWKGLEELNRTPEYEEYAGKEFPEYVPTQPKDNEPSRRDFLKAMGFSVAAVSLAACEAPVRKAIPYVRKPENIDPGVANYYASTFWSGSDVESIVVKTREGRPIKVEGNVMSSLNGGGTTAQMEASVLSLYDQQRFKGPRIEGQDASWEDVYRRVASALQSASGPVYLVSNTIASPSTQKSIDKLVAAFPNVKQVVYDQFSFHGSLEANAQMFGVRAIPSYDFSKARTIVSLDADFLGTWPNRPLNNKQFAQSRKLGGGKKEMSRLYAFESILSLTGSNADYRTPIKPSQQGAYAVALYNLVAQRAGAPSLNGNTVTDDQMLQKAATDLWNSRGSGVVLSGSNDTNVQLVINAINQLLGAYGTTLSLANRDNTRAGNDAEFNAFVDGLSSAGGVIFYNCNPIYDHPRGTEIAQNLSGLSFSLSTSDRLEETSDLVGINAPDSHYLESWNDFNPKGANIGFSQPTISKIFDSRQAQESFLAWSGNSISFYEFLQSEWSETYQPWGPQFDTFEMFWKQAIHDGIVEVDIEGQEEPEADNSSLADAAQAIASAYSDSNSGLELVIYQNNSVGNGIQSNNPWLQEMSEPITKACWDNYLTVSPRQAADWGIKLGDMTTQKVNLTVNGQTLSVPVLPQPGQKYDTIGLSVGYGRSKAGKVADNVGVNAYPLIDTSRGFVNVNITSGVAVEPTNESYQIAQTQTHHTYMGRENVIQETVLSAYQKDEWAGRSKPMIATAEGPKKPYAISLWKGHKYANHHWGMMVDLNSCTGCGSCTIACQTENNIPVIGKKEVLNRRDMNWLRIDRYYSSDAADGDLAGMEKAAENPEVTFQPMMCQQCNNAPCETVCPVAATTHSSEGLNQMAYNRCVGTRYCANNCPYKVRRFNYFKFHDNDWFADNLSMNNDLGKMVLNPDVTVRSRGVIEKCSFCVQRIQEGKLTARKEKRLVKDGDITTACASSCPSDAIVFGDMKDPKSRISEMLKIKSMDKGVEAGEPRAYHVLEEIGVMPNVWYLTKVRNKEENKSAEANA